ncbi:hypothetical protein [Pedobacter heparinus]|uniref:hypothetical protein n=1 Tax=Pedobacter heparinus TaxID=984 RepID=UPI0029304A45|nr:hypothetical protein [Pedobacter heparinus]
MKLHHKLFIGLCIIITIYSGFQLLAIHKQVPRHYKRGHAPFSPSQPVDSAELNYGSMTLDDLLLLPKLGFHSISFIAEAAMYNLNTNAGSYVYNDRLYVHSNLPAVTEDPYVFKWYTVIDVYVYNKGDRWYLYSYYLPEFKGHKVREFKVTADHIIAFQGNYKVTYKIFKDTLHRVREKEKKDD